MILLFDENGEFSEFDGELTKVMKDQIQDGVLFAVKFEHGHFKEFNGERFDIVRDTDLDLYADKEEKEEEEEE